MKRSTWTQHILGSHKTSVWPCPVSRELCHFEAGIWWECHYIYGAFVGERNKNEKGERTRTPTTNGFQRFFCKPHSALNVAGDQYLLAVTNNLDK